LRFIRNETDSKNLTTFHSIYIKESNLFNKIDIDLLFAYLLTDTAKNIFSDNRREYGNGLTKFEPNDLNNSYILNIFNLEERIIDEILNLYFKYRESILKNRREDKTYIDMINTILEDNFKRMNI
jgi:adenine-specific DNA-methyltransferase